MRRGGGRDLGLQEAQLRAGRQRTRRIGGPRRGASLEDWEGVTGVTLSSGSLQMPTGSIFGRNRFRYFRLSDGWIAPAEEASGLAEAFWGGGR